jgi:hypothetical protein
VHILFFARPFEKKKRLRDKLFLYFVLPVYTIVAVPNLRKEPQHLFSLPWSLFCDKQKKLSNGRW